MRRCSRSTGSSPSLEADAKYQGGHEAATLPGSTRARISERHNITSAHYHNPFPSTLSFLEPPQAARERQGGRD